MSAELEKNSTNEVQFSNLKIDWSVVWQQIGGTPRFVDKCPIVATAIMNHLLKDMNIPAEDLAFKSVRTGPKGFFVHIWVEHKGQVVDIEEFRGFFGEEYTNGATDRDFMEKYLANK